MKRKDYYYKKAKKERYRSRASYKLKQLNKKFRIIKFGNNVLDLGAAPGGWTQVAREIVGEKGLVIAVDLKKIKNFEWANVYTIQGDFTKKETLNKINEICREFDVIISDASPNISGIWDIDHFKSIELCEEVLRIADMFLKPQGNLLVKVFQGKETTKFINKVKNRFKYVKITKPKASRKESAEIYVIAKKFKSE